MDRRHFTKLTLSSAAILTTVPTLTFNLKNAQSSPIRLGVPIFEKYDNPDEWIAILKKLGYSAAYCPVELGTSAAIINAYEQAAIKADIWIAEVGSWVNTLDEDLIKRKENIEKCQKSLALADAIGARCCVNISGSRNQNHWAGPAKNNLTQETFDMVVQSTREIIDAVKPKRSFYTIENMPWMYPDSVDSCLALIKAIDRKQFGIHFDPVNFMADTRSYYGIGQIIRDAFKRLGSHIKSCHGKDLQINEEVYTPQFSECIPGQGAMDYATFLTEISKHGNVPLMLEHLTKPEEYKEASNYVRKVGMEKGVRFL